MRTPYFLTCLLASSLTALAATQEIASPAVHAEQDAAIRAHRMGRIIVHAAPGSEVSVQQLRHEYWFGAALASSAFNGRMSPADTAAYQRTFLENFNSGVPEVAFKWHAMEITPGKVEYGLVDTMLAWADVHRIPLRGHNIFWGTSHWVQPWLKALDNAGLRQALEQRARDVGRRYRGRFAEYDFNNEMIHGDYYVDRLGPGITARMAQWVREEDPNAVLYVNDYDITTGVMLDRYVAHTKKLIAMGVPIGGIGVQGHLHGDTFDPAALRHSLDVLAQFKLPIRITEFNFPGQRSRFYEHPEIPTSAVEEEQKAKALVEFYRICFAHPATDGILMWGFWAGANWIPQSSLYQRDWTPTPAAAAYRDLVFHQWWTNWHGRADANGSCEVPAFYGQHRVTVGAKTADVSLRKQDGTATVDLR